MYPMNRIPIPHPMKTDEPDNASSHARSHTRSNSVTVVDLFDTVLCANLWIKRVCFYVFDSRKGVL